MCVVEPNMAVHQSKHQSDLEKRLKILRQQFYGKEQVSSSKYYVLSENTKESVATLNTKYITPNTDVTYLQGDLMKISILAGAALTLQIILYFLIKNNILNINLF